MDIESCFLRFGGSGFVCLKTRIVFSSVGGEMLVVDSDWSVLSIEKK